MEQQSYLYVTKYLHYVYFIKSNLKLKDVEKIFILFVLVLDLKIIEKNIHSLEEFCNPGA